MILYCINLIFILMLIRIYYSGYAHIVLFLFPICMSNLLVRQGGVCPIYYILLIFAELTKNYGRVV